MFSAKLLEYFEHPRNVGELDNASVNVRVENPVCADVLQLAIRIKDGRIRAARFLAKGCVPSMACASALTVLLEGRLISSARSLTAADVAAEVGGVPQASMHAAQLAIDALKAALERCSSKVTHA